MTPLNPMNDLVQIAALSLFSKVSIFTTALVSMAFVMRTCFMVLRVAPAYEYGELVKQTATYLALVMIFPKFVNLVLTLTAALAERISYIPQVQSQSTVQSFFVNLFTSSSIFAIFGKLGAPTMMVLANSCYTISIGLLLAIAPIVLFLSVMLGLSHGVNSYFSALLALSLWPVLWNLLGKLGSELMVNASEAPLRTVVFWFVIQALQLLSPLYAVVLFKGLSSPGIINKIVKIGI